MYTPKLRKRLRGSVRKPLLIELFGCQSRLAISPIIAVFVALAILIVMLVGYPGVTAGEVDPRNHFVDSEYEFTYEPALEISQSSLLSADVSPSPRRDAAMAFDKRTGQMILFGGHYYEASNQKWFFLSDTWSWNGHSWTQLRPPSSPRGRRGHKMVYDPLRQEIILFGGQCGRGNVYCNDMWAWDGSGWRELHPRIMPSARFNFGMAYSPIDQKIMLYGGNTAYNYFSDTWLWDGSNWTQLSESSLPGIKRSMMMADGVLMYGGMGRLSIRSTDTWEFSSNSWSRITVDRSPEERSGAAMITDRKGQLLFGGTNGPETKYNDTWRYSNGRWTKLIVSSAPSARYGAAMAYDSNRDRTVLFGGGGSIPYMADTWEWTGNNWHLAVAGPTPTPTKTPTPTLTPTTTNTPLPTHTPAPTATATPTPSTQGVDVWVSGNRKALLSPHKPDSITVYLHNSGLTIPANTVLIAQFPSDLDFVSSTSRPSILTDGFVSWDIPDIRFGSPIALELTIMTSESSMGQTLPIEFRVEPESPEELTDNNRFVVDVTIAKQTYLPAVHDNK